MFKSMDSEKYINLVIKKFSKIKDDLSDYDFNEDFDENAEKLLKIIGDYPTNENLINCYLDFIDLDCIDDFENFRNYCRKLVNIYPQWADKVVDSMLKSVEWDEDDWECVAPHASKEKIYKWGEYLIEVTGYYVETDYDNSINKKSLLCLVKYCSDLSEEAVNMLLNYDEDIEKIVDTIVEFAPEHLEFYVGELCCKHEDNIDKISTKCIATILKNVTPEWDKDVVDWLRGGMSIDQLVEFGKTIKENNIKSKETETIAVPFDTGKPVKQQPASRITVETKPNKSAFFFE